MLDTGENPDAPQPREMIDLEVRTSHFMIIGRSVLLPVRLSFRRLGGVCILAYRDWRFGVHGLISGGNLV